MGALGVASLTGTDLAGAAAVRATNLMDLIDQRSPGVRTEGQLTKMRRMAPAPLEEFAPPAALPTELAQALSPPSPVELAVDIKATPAPTLFAPPLPGGIFMAHPGGGGGPPGGGGGGGPPGGGGGSPPGSPPIVVPQGPGAVPEPGTWMTMLLGFGLMGWTIRRQRALPATAESPL